MKEVLCDQNHADVSLMATFHKQVAHLLGIDVVQQIVEDHEARSTASVFKKSVVTPSLKYTLHFVGSSVGVGTAVFSL